MSIALYREHSKFSLLGRDREQVHVNSKMFINVAGSRHPVQGETGTIGTILVIYLIIPPSSKHVDYNIYVHTSYKQ